MFDPKGAELAVQKYQTARGAFADAILELSKTPQVQKCLFILVGLLLQVALSLNLGSFGRHVGAFLQNDELLMRLDAVTLLRPLLADAVPR